MHVCKRLLAFALLCGATLLTACNQEESAPAQASMGNTSDAFARTSASEPTAPQVPWSELSDWQRSVLSVLETQWNRIPAAEQQVFMRGADHWTRLQPAEQDMMKQHWAPYVGHPKD